MCDRGTEGSRRALLPAGVEHVWGEARQRLGLCLLRVWGAAGEGPGGG